MNSDAEFAGFHLEKMFGFLSHRATPGTIIHFTLWLFNIAMANGTLENLSEISKTLKRP